MIRFALPLVLLTGCVTPTPEATQSVTFGANGVIVGDAGLEISFGRAQDGAVTAMSQLIGPPNQTYDNQECGAGPITTVSWDGVDMLFMFGDFRGWVLSAPFDTSIGVTVGMTPEPDTVLQDTSLGQEFGIGGVYALIATGDTIDTVWAGVSCFFR